MPANCNIKKVRIQLFAPKGRMGKALLAAARHDPEVDLCEEGDVLIDFSSCEGTCSAAAIGKPLVCGTTGLSEIAFTKLHLLSKKVPVLYSPNFSLGMGTLFYLLEHLPKEIRQKFNITISETHHVGKKDAPSGTASKLAHLLQTDQIEVHRIEEVVGIHQIILNRENEKLIFEHNAFSRNTFAQGALHAAKWISTRPPGFYELSALFH